MQKEPRWLITFSASRERTYHKIFARDPKIVMKLDFACCERGESLLLIGWFLKTTYVDFFRERNELQFRLSQLLVSKVEIYRKLNARDGPSVKLFCVAGDKSQRE